MKLETYGAGEAVVLLHGFTSRGDSWRRWGWVDRLVAHGFVATLVDFPGHGDGAPPDAENTTITALAAQVVDMLDQIGAADACLVGFSMGGGVALHLAVEVPERLRRVVVAGVGDEAVNAWRDDKRIAELRAAFAGEPAPARWTDSIVRNAELAGNDPRGLVSFLRHGGWPGGLARLEALRVPTLFVVAEDDEYMPTAARLLAELAPAQVLRCAGSHHEILGDPTVQEAAVAFLAQGRIE
ncbi:MAG TPA: alpha/beta fold hydrolase [Gaiellaceae bacterium]